MRMKSGVVVPTATFIRSRSLAASTIASQATSVPSRSRARSTMSAKIASARASWAWICMPISNSASYAVERSVCAFELASKSARCCAAEATRSASLFSGRIAKAASTLPRGPRRGATSVSPATTVTSSPARAARAAASHAAASSSVAACAPAFSVPASSAPCSHTRQHRSARAARKASRRPLSRALESQPSQPATVSTWGAGSTLGGAGASAVVMASRSLRPQTSSEQDELRAGSSSCCD